MKRYIRSASDSKLQRLKENMIISWKELEDVENPYDKPIILVRNIMYDYVDPVRDNVEDLSNGTYYWNEFDEFARNFIRKSGKLYLPAGTTLKYKGDDAYYTYYEINGGPAQIAILQPEEW